MVRTLWFESISDLLDCEVPKINRAVEDSTLNMHASNWLGVEGGHKQVRLNCEQGWAEGLRVARDLASRLNHDALGYPASKSFQRKRRRTRGDFGNELDIHAVYQGRSDTAWSKTERVIKALPTKSVVVFINVGLMAAVNVSASMWRAAAMQLIYTALTKAGRSLKIVVGSVASGVYKADPDAPYTVVTGCVVKDYRESLNEERLAAMSYGGYHRSLNFKARCCSKSKASTGMGSTVNDTNILPITLIRERQNGVKVVHLGTCLTQSQAQAAVDSVIKQLANNEI